MTKKTALLMQGRCGDCGGPRDSDLTRCAKCRERRKKLRAKRYQDFRERGICVKCEHRSAEGGVAVCQQCRKDQNERAEHKRAEAAAKGLCVWCMKSPVQQGAVYCDRCCARRAKLARRHDREIKPYVQKKRKPRSATHRVPRVSPKRIEIELEDALFSTEPDIGREIVWRIRDRIRGQQFPDSLVGQWLQPEMGRCA